MAVAGVVAAALWIVWLAGDFGDATWLAVAGLLGLASVPLAIGVAILRFRLYEIDALLRRSVVYATVTALLLGAYVALLLVIGPVPGTGRGLAVSIVTAVPVALLFGPLRRRLQRAVNRRLYGDDDDPHAAVRELGRSLAGSLAPAAALPTVVETVTRTLRVPYAAILLERDGALEQAAASGEAPPDRLSLPLAYAGASVGVLEIGLRAGDELSAVDRMLLAGLARQAGVAAHAVQIAADLQRSRERLVSAREEERRRLRRDLHDGLGPTLAAMVLQLQAADHLIATGSPAAGEAARRGQGGGALRRRGHPPPGLRAAPARARRARPGRRARASGGQRFSPLDVRVEAPAPVRPAACRPSRSPPTASPSRRMTNVARHARRAALPRPSSSSTAGSSSRSATTARDSRALPRERRPRLHARARRGARRDLYHRARAERRHRVRARIPMPEE